MEIVVLGLLAFAGYKFFRLTTRAGSEAVRAYIYLETLNKGISPYEANAMTNAMISDLASDMAGGAIDMAKREYQQVHNGKQLAVIGFAYRNGMRSNMPFWYVALARAVPPTTEVEFRYGRLRPELMPENLQRLGAMVADEGYKSFCDTFCNEVNRLAGEEHYEQSEGGVLDNKALYQLYKQGDDPLVTAIMYCHENGVNREAFDTFDSYLSAFATELLRLANSPAQLNDWLSKVDSAKLLTSFKAGTHPRLAAVGYHEIVSQPRWA